MLHFFRNVKIGGSLFILVTFRYISGFDNLTAKQN